MDDHLLDEAKQRVRNNPVYNKPSTTREVYNQLDQLEGEIQCISTQVQEFKYSLNQLKRSKRQLLNSRTWRIGLAMDRILSACTFQKFNNGLAKKLDSQVTEVQKMIRSIERSFNFYTSVKRLKSHIELRLFNQQVTDPELVDVKFAQTLSFNEFEQPQVSIIIPVYNNAHYTYVCLKSILVNTKKEIQYEVIVVDDCSTEQSSVDLIEKSKNVRFIKNKENQGFLRSCNVGSSHAKGEFIVFLNNDTSVQKGWLDSLINTFEIFPETGLAGSKLIYPDGTLQEAGGIIWDDASGWNFGRLQKPDSPDYSYSKEVDYISGASIIIRSALWQKIGGFDDRYAPAYYEDTDLAFEVRKRGLKVMYQPWSEVIHYEGKSHGTDLESGIKKYQKINREKFVEKWQADLEKQNGHGKDAFLARDRSTSQKTILFIDHHVPYFDRDAGSRSVFGYLKLFKKHGYNVKLLGDNFQQTQPYSEVLGTLGIEVLYGSWYKQNLEDWLKENGKYFQNVFLNRPHIAPKYVELLRKYTKANLMYYGHDLYFMRYQRKKDLGIAINEKQTPEQIKKEELELIGKVDVAFYPSQVEVDLLKSIDKKFNVDQIPVYLFDEFQETSTNFEDTAHIIFIGGFAHPPNVDGIKWFVNESWPLIKKQIPEIKLYIIGNSPPADIMEMDSDDIRVTGHVSEKTLQTFYTNSRISIAPLRYGAGIKGKVVEALYNKLPVVTTSIGAEGLVDAKNYMMVEDDPRSFSEAVIRLYKDKNFHKKFSEKGKSYCQEYFSYDHAWSVLSKYIKT